MKRIVMAMLPLMLWAAGCAGTPFKWEDTEKVRDGMTEQEVVAILGQPYSRTQSGKTRILTWSYSAAFSETRAVSYAFVDGRVTGAPKPKRPGG